MSEQEAARLRAEGWTIISSDEPARAMRGFVAIKDGEVERTVTWPMFEGGPYRTNDAIVSATDLLRFIKGGGTLRCDNPMKRLLGYVRYDHGTMTAFVRYCTLTSLRAASEADKATIMAARSVPPEPA